MLLHVVAGCAGTWWPYICSTWCSLVLSLVFSSPHAGCGHPALLHSAHHMHIIITTDVGIPLCWRLTRCHWVQPSQVGKLVWVDVGNKYSKPFAFVCICKHTATCILQGWSTGSRYLTVRVSWPSTLDCNPCKPPVLFTAVLLKRMFPIRMPRFILGLSTLTIFYKQIIIIIIEGSYKQRL